MLCAADYNVEVNGERQLLKQEGRVERWPSHMQPWMPPWTRELSAPRNRATFGDCDDEFLRVGFLLAERIFRGLFFEPPDLVAGFFLLIFV